MKGAGVGMNRRILVIDDNEAIHDDFRKILSVDSGTAALDREETALFGETVGQTFQSVTDRQESRSHRGFEIDSASQGEEGLALVRKAIREERPYAMAFVDVRMPPGWDGIETVARIWKEYPDLEVVICTAYSDYSWDEVTEKLDRADHLLILKKPFDHIEVHQLACSLTERWNLAHHARHRMDKLDQMEQADAKLPVVVVDDDAPTVELYKRFIEHAGYEVHGYTNSGRAWDSLLKTGDPVVLVTDWRMPEPDGLELCRRIRRSDHLGKIYTILITAYYEPDDVVAALEAGADDYLAKSCNKYELLARIRAGERILRLSLRQRDYAKAMEAHNRALEAANEQAEQAVEELKQTQRQLLQADKMASIGQLAAGVAHEINNPIGFVSSNLNSLGQYVEDLKCVLAAYDNLLRECQEPRRDREGACGLATKAEEVQRVREDKDIDYIVSDLANLIEESVEGTQRVRQIVADLRDFSHVDNADVVEEEINELLNKTINVAWNELKYKTEVVREYGEIPPIPCYGGKLGQVFLNLLVNAAQAIEERGTITVRTGRDRDRIWIEVADTGRGIPRENLDRIFDPFFTTKDVGKGTGLGLHLAYNIIHAHGGFIECKSTVGEGTTFRIELPVSGPPEAQENRCESVA